MYSKEGKNVVVVVLLLQGKNNNKNNKGTRHIFTSAVEQEVGIYG
jgi:hypothetical protein